jgi:hypothetical protein
MTENNDELTQEELDTFFNTAAKLVEYGKQGSKIIEAVKTGKVESERYVRDPAAAYDERIREMAREVIFSIWNNERRAAKLQEIYEGVRKKVSEDIESGEWPKVWYLPSKRTVDRRVNELAEQDSSKWGPFEVAPCICLKAGYYQPNPYLFEDTTKEALLG